MLGAAAGNNFPVALDDAAAVVPYEPEWPSLFDALGQKLRVELGPVALRIDHIGSTAVPGLDAKPIIDVQISVASLEPVDTFRVPLERWIRVASQQPRPNQALLPGAAGRAPDPHPRAAGRFVLRAVRAPVP
jgi:GrpB-like predicted nucleotidyltransferase (UPF0157 family)